MVRFGPKVSVSIPPPAVVVLRLLLVSSTLVPIPFPVNHSILGSNSNPYAAPAAGGTLDNYGNAASGYPAPAASNYNNMGSGYMQGDPHVRITTQNQPDVCYDVKD